MTKNGVALSHKSSEHKSEALILILWGKRKGWKAGEATYLCMMFEKCFFSGQPQCIKVWLGCILDYSFMEVRL